MKVSCLFSHTVPQVVEELVGASLRSPRSPRSPRRTPAAASHDAAFSLSRREEQLRQVSPGALHHPFSGSCYPAWQQLQRLQQVCHIHVL